MQILARKCRWALLKLYQVQPEKQRGSFYSCLHFSEVVKQNLDRIMPQSDFENQAFGEKDKKQKDTIRLLN